MSIRDDPPSIIGQKVTQSRFTCNGRKPYLLPPRCKDMNTVQEYREKAAQARRLADSILDPAVREHLETAARDYDQMADQLEECSARGR